MECRSHRRNDPGGKPWFRAAEADLYGMPGLTKAPTTVAIRTETVLPSRQHQGKRLLQL